MFVQMFPLEIYQMNIWSNFKIKRIQTILVLPVAKFFYTFVIQEAQTF